MNELPWYQAGLKFECTQCGNCCTGAPGNVWVNKEEMAALAARLNITAEEFEDGFVRRVGLRRSLLEFPNGDCIFFDSEKRICKVYDARPRQCKTFPFWGSILKSPQAWERMCQDCPGGNQGRLVPLEEIEAKRDIVKI
jgi:Fe-S-cluster containining protein